MNTALPQPSQATSAHPAESNGPPGGAEVTKTLPCSAAVEGVSRVEVPVASGRLMINLGDGALAKVARAEEHFRGLRQETQQWLERANHQMAREANEDQTEFRFFTDWRTPPDGDR